MISRQVFSFRLRAKTSLYFGGVEPGKLLLRTDDQPMISGNAIGGLLREWLQNKSELLDMSLLQVLGDEECDEAGKKRFRASEIRINDGQLLLLPSLDQEKGFPKKEGTAINAATGTALSHAKYTYEYLPEGTEIHFDIECDLRQSSDGNVLTEDKLKRMFSAWAAAIDQGDVRFGGKKSLGYGVCEVCSAEWVAYDFTSAQDIDSYLFASTQDVDVARRTSRTASLNREPLGPPVFVCRFRMEGSFPYGVYMADFDKKDTPLLQAEQDGKLQATIPSSSLKGVIRHDVGRLVQQMLSQTQPAIAVRKAQEYESMLFGGTDRAGVIIVHDLSLSGQEVQAERVKSEKFTGTPTYVKIDRITGGVVDTQLCTQREVQGHGVIMLEVRLPVKADDTFDPESVCFPLIYALRRIGSGQLPVGGRTSTGLGIFKAEAIQVELNEVGIRSFTVRVDGQSDAQVMDRLRQSYDRFRRWCLSDTAME